MSSAVKPFTAGDVPALALSVALHAALLLPLAIGLYGHVPPRPPALPNNVAMQGDSLEIDAPTPELAAAAASPASERQAEPVHAPSQPSEPSPKVVAAEDAAQAVPAPSPRAPRPPTVAAPRPARQPVSKPARPSAPPSRPAAGSDTPNSGAPASGSFGQEGLAPGVRRLGYAFTRAIPAATPGDSAWRELPTGHVGTIRIELEVDENRRLGAVKRWSGRAGEPAPPPVLERMIERTILLLRSGQFALSGSNEPGSERLVIDVSLHDEAADEDGTQDVVQKKFDGATPGHPGKAYFRYGTGRAFEAKISIAPAK